MIFHVLLLLCLLFKDVVLVLLSEFFMLQLIGNDDKVRVFSFNFYECALLLDGLLSRLFPFSLFIPVFDFVFCVLL